MCYVIGIDQSTQGTKAILFDQKGKICYRADRPHRQIVNDRGWVSHDMEEIYQKLLDEIQEILKKTGIDPKNIAAVGISNQRETTIAWGDDGKPLAKAVVWQCGRAKEITERIKQNDPSVEERIRRITGIPLSPFFPAAKMRWMLEQGQMDETDGLHLGTVDSYLIYRLTKGKVFATDYSNASRTQLFDLHALAWSKEVCGLFGIPMGALPEVLNSDGDFGTTDFEGILPKEVKICAVMGDSHCALYGQGCHQKGMMKTTYGTGSSMMLNTGNTFVESRHGLATSLAWGIDGEVSYVLEGNINYTGAVMSWLKDDLGMISSTGEIEPLIAQANSRDTTVMVPAFTGLGAPYWDNEAKASITGMSRTTKRPEIVKSAVESIAHQIADVFEAMEKDYGGRITQLRADGGPTKNRYLMQYQSDMICRGVMSSEVEELSAIGAAYLAGISAGCYNRDEIFSNIAYASFTPRMSEEERQERRGRWKNAINQVLEKKQEEM